MSVFDSLFTPFGKEYCAWYYYWMIIMFIVFALVLISLTARFLSGKEKLLTVVTGIVVPFLSYFNFRLLYSMCVN